MPETDHPTSETTNPEVRHERSDANVRAIIWFGVGLVTLGVVVHVMLAWMFVLLERDEDAEQKPIPRLIAEERQKQEAELIPPMDALERSRQEKERLRKHSEGESKPRLQIDQFQDLNDLREAE